MLSGHGCYLCKTTWWLRYRQCAPVPVEGKRCSNCNRKALLRLNSVEWGLLMRDAIRPFNTTHIPGCTRAWAFDNVAGFDCAKG